MRKNLKDILLGAILVAAFLPLAAFAARTSIDWVNQSGTTYIQPNYPTGVDLLIYGSNHYLNFNTVTGSFGYGFRDNAGVLQFKNSGGAWTAFGSGSGGNVSTSTTPTIGQVAYWTTSGATPELLGSAATSSETCSAPLSCGSHTVLAGGGAISIPQANGSTDGYLFHTDWSIFNNKQATLSATWPQILTGATLSFGGLGTTTNLTQGQLPYVTGVNTFGQVSTSTLTPSSPLTGSLIQIGNSGSIGCQTASGSQAGCLSSTDWTTFNNKGSGTVTSVTATYPILSTGGNTPVISTAFGTTTNWGLGNNGIVVTSATGIPFISASSSLNLPNSALQNSSVTVNTSAPLGGGGSVSLGGTALTLTCASCATFTYPFPNTDTNFGNNANATSSVVGFTGGILASSTSQFANASSTLFTVSGTQWIKPLATPAGAFLAVDAAGKVISTTTPSSGGTPGGSNTDVQFNDAGSFGGNGNFTFDKTTNSITLGIPTQSITDANVSGGQIGDANIIFPSNNGGTSLIQAFNATTSGQSGENLDIYAGNASTTGLGGEIQLFSGNSEGSSGGATISINGGNALGSGGGGVAFIGGGYNSDFSIEAPVEIGGTNANAALNADSLSAPQTFTFPNQSGTFCLTVTCIGTTTTAGIGNNLSLYTSNSGVIIGVATSSLSAGTGLTGSFPIIGPTGSNSIALSVPVSIANGGTATTTGGVTNGVEYYNGTTLTNNANLKYQPSVNNCQGTGISCGRITLSDPTTIFSSFNGGSRYLVSSSTAEDDFLGLNAGNLTGGYNNGAGGGFDLAFGRSAMSQISTGYQNVAIGTQALTQNTTGYDNLAVGSLALNNITTGHDDIGFGNQALYVRATTTNYSVAVGSLALTRMNDVGTACDGTQGDAWETAVGTFAGQNLSIGCNNTFIGASAGNNDTAGSNNIAIGAWPTQLYGPTTGSTNILIGYNNDLPDDTASNQLDIGNLLYGTGLTSTGATVSSGKIGIGTSTPWAYLSVAGSNGGSPLFAAASSTVAGSSLPNFEIDSKGYILTSGPVPAVSSCGTSPTISGNDTNFRVHVGSVAATGCTITFANSHGTLASPPICVVIPETGSLAFDPTASTTPTAVVIGGGTLTGDWLVGHCEAYQ